MKPGKVGRKLTAVEKNTLLGLLQPKGQLITKTVTNIARIAKTAGVSPSTVNFYYWRLRDSKKTSVQPTPTPRAPKTKTPTPTKANPWTTGKAPKSKRRDKTKYKDPMRTKWHTQGDIVIVSFHVSTPLGDVFTTVARAAEVTQNHRNHLLGVAP